MKKVLILAMGVLLIAGCSKKDVASTGKNGSTAIEYGISGSDAGQAGDLKTIHFDYDAATLTAEAKTILKANVEWLKKNPKKAIQVEGHCDSRGTIEYNLALGERRAISTKKYLSVLGVKNKISVISYGKERPLDRDEDEAAWAKNRRANFVIVSK